MGKEDLYASITLVKQNPKKIEAWISYIETLIYFKLGKEAFTAVHAFSNIFKEDASKESTNLKKEISEINSVPSLIDIEQKVYELFQTKKFKDLVWYAEICNKYTDLNCNIYSAVGTALMYEKRYDDAVIYHEKAVSTSDASASAYNNFGNTLRRMGKYDEAKKSFEKACALENNNNNILFNMACNLKDLKDLNGARKIFKRVLSNDKNFYKAHAELGKVAYEIGKPYDALKELKIAETLFPSDVDVLNTMAVIYLGLGEIEHCIELYSKVLKLNPKFPEAHRNLSLVETYKTKNEQYYQILENLREPGLSLKDKYQYQFALAKIYKDIGEDKNFISSLRIANAYRKETLSYSFNEDVKIYQQIVKLENVTKHIELPHSTDVFNKRPIFIIGMPRSGTSLVEQILASHPKVSALGELEYFGRLIQKYYINEKNISEDHLVRIRREYIEKISQHQIQEAIYTDKMPLNLRWVNVILKCFPDAKFVYCERDPMAVCWSIFQQCFTSNGNAYGYDELDVSNYYKMHKNLMEYWLKQYPEKIIRLNYEKLVEQPKQEIKMLLNELGLEWNSSCLEHHKLDRAVATASNQQVRKAIYGGSSQGWLRYSKYLGKMRANLNLSV